MNKKTICILIALIFGLCCQGTAYAIDTFSDSENNHLRIFTPYHSLKPVFAQVYGDGDTQAANSQIIITKDDYELMATVVYAESQGEPFEGKVGVASVILNRLYHPEFPKSIRDIIFQKNAFSCVKDGNLNARPDIEAYKAVDEALKGNDPTSNALFFYNPLISSCSWMRETPKAESVTIGRHVFFK